MFRHVSHVISNAPSCHQGLSYSRSLSSCASLSNLKQLYLQHGFASFDKQMALVDVVSTTGVGSQCDLMEQSLAFGSTSFKMQVIGSECTSSNTWKWGWANRLSVPEAAARASEEMLALGQQENIPELIQGTLSLTEEVNGHYLVTIASGVCNGNAYFRWPHEHGALFMLIRDQHFPRKTVYPAMRIISVVNQALSAVTISDHKVAFRHYLKYHHGRIEETDDTIRAEFDDRYGIEAKFEPQSNRLKQMDVVPT